MIQLQDPSIKLTSSFIEFAKSMSSESEREKYAFKEDVILAQEDPVKLIESLLILSSGIKSGTNLNARKKLWIVYKSEVIGQVSIKNVPEKYLLNNEDFHGGHIGYKIKPSHRGRGFGTIACKLAIQYCKEHYNLKKIMITCNEDNFASKRIIEKNGGVPTESFVTEFGDKKLRYWIYT